MEQERLTSRVNYQGEWEMFFDDGSLRAKGSYVDGLKHGEWVYYFETGEVEQKGVFDMGELVRRWTWYSKWKVRRERITRAVRKMVTSWS